jgi:hypothetical protein
MSSYVAEKVGICAKKKKKYLENDGIITITVVHYLPNMGYTTTTYKPVTVASIW